MRRIFPVIWLISLFSFGCKKAAENVLDDMILKSMTDGQWIVTSFTENGSDITADFVNYKFQYHSNKTVDAIKNGVIEQKGKWDGNSLEKKTWADFPAANRPLVLLNGTWKISNNTWTYVVASQTNGAIIKTFRLEKL